MQGVLIMAALIAVWKLGDVFLSAYQMYLSAVIECFKTEKESAVVIDDEDKREIGFNSYGNTVMRVDEEEYGDE